MECKSLTVEQMKPPHRWELIDTLWNVNVFTLDLVFINMRINRYIMECKLHKQSLKN